MMRGKIIIAAILLLFATGTLEAQTETYTLKGSLKDANDDSAMIYTNCVLLHTADSSFVYGVTSDDKGFFCFNGIAEGKYLLRISFIGYDTYWQPVSVNNNHNLGIIKLVKVPSPAATSVSALLGASVAPKWKANKLTARSPVGERTDIKLGKLSKILRNFVT